VNWFQWLAEASILDVSLPATVALAAVAVTGYVFGRRGGERRKRIDARQATREIEQTRLVAQELEWIADKIRKSLAKHHTSLARFQKKFRQIDSDDSSPSWQELRSEADDVLGPTLQLAEEISRAYDQIRQQSRQLLSFDSTRPDADTGVYDRRVLEKAMHGMFAMQHQFGLRFSVVMLSLADGDSQQDEDAVMYEDTDIRRLSKCIRRDLRDGDVLVHDAGKRFVIVLPAADTAAAGKIAARLRESIAARFSLQIDTGVATALPGETPDDLLARVHEAVQEAQRADEDAAYEHDGDHAAPVNGAGRHQRTRQLRGAGG
jgi:diguanylate cyclase (GGDEF)-like protein